LNSGNTGIFLDFGMNFSETGKYFEEFLTPRLSTHGIYDLLNLGLVPRVKGVYREDALLFAPELRDASELVLDGVFLSHAHADHVGYLGLVRPDVPVYCSDMTAMMIKATQDSGAAGIEAENVFTAPREVDTDGIEPKLTKVKNAFYQRKYLAVGPCDRLANVKSYWGETFASERTKNLSSYVFEGQAFTEADGTIGDIRFEALPVDHSVYGATAYVFDIGDKTICYSGDFRMHGWRPEVSAAFRERLKEIRPDYLIVEGTNVGGHKGNDTDVQQRASEEDVHQNCLAAVREAEGKAVLADFGLRNIERLLIFLEIAKETGRRLAVTTKDLFFLHAMAHADASINDALNDAALAVYEKNKGTEFGWEKAIKALYEDKYLSCADVKGNMDKFVLAFSFWDIKELLSLEPYGGVYIYSTCEAFSEEMEIDVWRLGNWLTKFEMETVGVKFLKLGDSPSDCEIEFVPGYHASGHISSRELSDFIDYVQPGAVIPIHTLHPEMFDEMLGGRHKVIIPEIGKPIPL
jgi:ribonuclease J